MPHTLLCTSELLKIVSNWGLFRLNIGYAVGGPRVRFSLSLEPHSPNVPYTGLYHIRALILRVWV